MSIEPGYSGQAFMPEALDRIAELATLVEVPIQVDGGIGKDNIESVRSAGATAPRRRDAVFADPDPAAAYLRLAAAAA